MTLVKFIESERERGNDHRYLLSKIDFCQIPPLTTLH